MKMDLLKQFENKEMTIVVESAGRTQRYYGVLTTVDEETVQVTHPELGFVLINVESIIAASPNQRRA